MIQRTQSIYLLLGAVAIMLPTYTLMGQAKEDDGLITDLYMPLVLAIVAYLAAATAIINIFLFKKRRLQMSICAVIMVISIVVASGNVLFVYTRAGTITLELFAFAPLGSTILFSLALMGIRKDERIVQSMDRFREG